MLKEAYDIGAFTACMRMGLVKEGGSTGQILKAMLQGVTGKVRGSLKSIAETATKRKELASAAKGLGADAVTRSKMLSEVNSDLLSKGAPWIAAGGGATAGYGGYQGAKALWPHAFED